MRYLSRTQSPVGSPSGWFFALLSGGLLALTGVACVPESTTETEGTECASGEIVQNGSCVPIPDGGIPDSNDNGDDDSDGGVDGNNTGPDTESLETWGDKDGDGEPNAYDNCPREPNPNQKDQDGDTVGDECDNCPTIANKGQSDSDDDMTGDACEEGAYYDRSKDSDGDGVPDVTDNCPNKKNPPNDNGKQPDKDNDLIGDACDNCPNVANVLQTDSDAPSEKGDACTTQPVGPECGTITSGFEEVKPNVYVLMDESGSMGSDNKMTKAKNAFRTLHNTVGGPSGSARFGLASFASASCPGLESEHLSINNAPHTTGDVECALTGSRTSGSCSKPGFTDGGGTDLGNGLEYIHQNDLYRGSGPLSDVRPAVVIAISDGKSSDDGICDPASDPAQRLHNAGVDVYAVGFSAGADMGQLDSIARAGGTNNPNRAGEAYQASANATDLANELAMISDSVVSCSYTLNKPKSKIDREKIWVSVDGSYIDRSKYSYDASSKTVTLNQATCNQVNSMSGTAQDIIKIKLGCPAECDGGEEICDYKDNDCDGKIDEGKCEDCGKEICGNDQDDDCDQQIDEGCPNCKVDGESCSSDSECCSDNCGDDGTCKPPCRPVNTVCSSDGQCCSENCATRPGQEGKLCQGG